MNSSDKLEIDAYQVAKQRHSSDFWSHVHLCHTSIV